RPAPELAEHRVRWPLSPAPLLVGDPRDRLRRLPVLVIWGVLRGSVVDYGFRVQGILPHAKIYGAMLLAIAPAVIAASFTSPFQQTYPFHPLNPGEPLWPRLWLWELLYASQFVALEFFFRGFLLHGLKRRLGYPAVWVMIVPYVMIH